MFKLIALAGALAAFGATAAQADDYNRTASAQAAQDWQAQAASVAPQVSPDQALNPQGPTLIASQPVPDTPQNRAQFGQPMSHAGKLTKPIGD